MYFNWEHLAVSLNIHIHSKVTLQGLSKYMLLLMATAASPVFFNHPPIWQVLRLSSLNLKRSNKSTFKRNVHTYTHTLRKCWFHGHHRFISRQVAIIWNAEKKKTLQNEKPASCLSSHVFIHRVTAQNQLHGRCLQVTQNDRNPAFRHHAVDENSFNL